MVKISLTYKTVLLILPPSKRNALSKKAWLLVVGGRVEVYIAAAILTEMAGKLREKFHWEDEWIKRAVRHIAIVARVVKPDARLAILKDEPDNRIL